MSDLAMVWVVAMVCAVCVVAICFGRKIVGRVKGDGAEMEVGKEEFLFGMSTKSANGVVRTASAARSD
jgi:hypothetical protein